MQERRAIFERLGELQQLPSDDGLRAMRSVTDTWLKVRVAYCTRPGSRCEAEACFCFSSSLNMPFSTSLRAKLAL